MEKQKTTTLAQKYDLRIDQYNCCGNISFMFKDLLLSFTLDGFLDFSTLFQELNFNKIAVIFGDGMQRLVINTYQKNATLFYPF